MSNVAIKEKQFKLSMTNVDLTVRENTEIADRKTNNKKTGQKSEVYAFEIEDLKKMIGYFTDREMWLHKMLFVLSCNLARRVGDMLSLRWVNFFNPETGKFRDDILEIVEDKTDKMANPHINSAVRAEILDYIKKTGCNPDDNEYQNPVFLQLTGNFKGRTISDSAYLKSLKKAACEVGIEYNVGTHSPRKTFGMLSRMIHPGDYDSMEILQVMYNHSDAKTTKHYIGLTKKKIDAYYDDMGNFFEEYVNGNKVYEPVNDKPVVSHYATDLRDIIAMALQMENNVDNFNTLLEMVEEVAL